MGALIACCLLAALCCTLPGPVQAAEVLPEEDAHIMRLLEPASRAALPGWMEAHERLAAEVAAAKGGSEVDIAMYGDSIMEGFRGESLGMVSPDGRYSANKETWDRLMAGKRARVFAISGDQITHLAWRLQNGEGPQGLSPQLATIMIGTNDVAHLGSTYRDNATYVSRVISLGVQQCVRELQRQAPQATVVVFGLLPIQPMMLHAPQRIFDELVAATNAELQRYVQAQASPQLRYKDCGGGFLGADGAVNYELMLDGVHPTGGGAEVLLRCMMEAMQL